MIDEQKMPILRLIVTVINSKSAKEATEYLCSEHVHLLYTFRAEGTASSEILDCLGLGVQSKMMTIGLTPREKAGELLENLSIRFRLMKPGHGIAFSMPISGAANQLMKLLNPELVEHIKQKPELVERIKHKIERDVEKLKSEQTHSLIMSVINQGYSEELMEAATRAGATGGTVIHARRVSGEEAVKLLGITLQDEKEIIIILAEKIKKLEIMKAISHQCGISTESQGVVFSLPVESVVGIENLGCDDLDVENS